jgi:hypothetical protein
MHLIIVSVDFATFALRIYVYKRVLFVFITEESLGLGSPIFTRNMWGQKKILVLSDHQ